MREGRLIVKLLCPEPRKNTKNFFAKACNFFTLLFVLIMVIR